MVAHMRMQEAPLPCHDGQMSDDFCQGLVVGKLRLSQSLSLDAFLALIVRSSSIKNLRLLQKLNHCLRSGNEKAKLQLLRLHPLVRVEVLPAQKGLAAAAIVDLAEDLDFLFLIFAHRGSAATALTALPGANTHQQ